MIEREKEYLIKLSGSDILDLINISASSKPELKAEILKKIESQIMSFQSTDNNANLDI